MRAFFGAGLNEWNCEVLHGEVLHGGQHINATSRSGIRSRGVCLMRKCDGCEHAVEPARDRDDRVHMCVTLCRH